MSLSASQRDAVLSGVSSHTDVFWALGAAILVILAGMWGFGKVVDLFQSRSAAADVGDGSFDEDSWLQDNWVDVQQPSDWDDATRAEFREFLDDVRAL